MVRISIGVGVGACARWGGGVTSGGGGSRRLHRVTWEGVRHGLSLRKMLGARKSRTWRGKGAQVARHTVWAVLSSTFGQHPLNSNTAELEAPNYRTHAQKKHKNNKHKKISFFIDLTGECLAGYAPDETSPSQASSSWRAR